MMLSMYVLYVGLMGEQLLVFFSMWVEAQFADVPQSIEEVIARYYYNADSFDKSDGFMFLLLYLLELGTSMWSINMRRSSRTGT